MVASLKANEFTGCMPNAMEELINAGMKQMDKTDQAIERSKQTEQMGRIVNELDSIQFSIKKALQLVKEIGRQVATDKCIMLLLVLIVYGVIAIIVVKVLSSFDLLISSICH
ncbi:hypothetical protein AHAS_Ahas18G0175900 [Arachis hypogaea]